MRKTRLWPYKTYFNCSISQHRIVKAGTQPQIEIFKNLETKIQNIWSINDLEGLLVMILKLKVELTFINMGTIIIFWLRKIE